LAILPFQPIYASRRIKTNPAGPDCAKPHVACSASFTYICLMKAVVINPKNNSELKFVTELLNKLGIKSAAISTEDLEDLAMSKILKKVDKSKKATRSEVMKKLSA
jgi:hypothetical protein